jgi:hypothetical protein
MLAATSSPRGPRFTIARYHGLFLQQTPNDPDTRNRPGDPVVWQGNAPILVLALLAACDIISPPPPPVVETQTLPEGAIGIAYTAGLDASGGDGSFEWRIAGGTLPAGLTLANTGLITGTPAASGLFSFGAEVESAGQRTRQTLTISIAAALEITSPDTLPLAIIGQIYTVTLRAEGGNASNYWSLTSGALPAGLTLSTFGAIAGIASRIDTAEFAVRVANSLGQSTTAQQTLVALVAPAVTTAGLPSGAVGIAYTANLTASGGDGKYTWTLSDGSLPAGLTLGAAGVITGTPTASGTFSPTVRVTSAGVTTVRQLSLVIAAELVITSPRTLPHAFVGQLYSTTLAVAGGDASNRWSLASGALPAGLTLSATGVIAGRPTRIDTAEFEVRVANTPGQSVLSAHELTSLEVPSIVTTSLAVAARGAPYTATLAARGGDGTYAWTVVAGALPSGLALSAAGAITGVPSDSGGASFTAQVASAGRTATRAFSLTVAARLCPGAIVGNPASKPTISITGLQPGGTVVRGTAANLDARKHRVVLWALTNYWYVQPLINSPFTPVCTDGTWQNSTHSWKRMVAVLVDSTYVPGAARFDHPGLERGVLAWTQVPPARPDIPLLFSGRSWGIKVAEDPFDPGSNPFSDSPLNVRVDDDGLHLGIIFQNGRWTSSEVHLLESLGYGEYTVQLASRVDSLDARAVFGMFLYESLTREIDIEFSRALAAPNNAQYVAQPYTRVGNRVTFRMSSDPKSTHRIVWRSGRVEILSWAGWEPYPPAADKVISSWTYTGPDVPPPGGERFRFNLWLVSRPPARGDEVIIRSFVYRP